MAFRRRQYLHLVNFALFGAVTIWTVRADLRLTPGFAAMAVGQGLLAFLVLRSPAAPTSAFLTLAFLGVNYLALAYWVAAIAGAPDTARFWAIFVVAAAIFAPVLLLAWRGRATWVARTRASGAD